MIEKRQSDKEEGFRAIKEEHQRLPTVGLLCPFYPSFCLVCTAIMVTEESNLTLETEASLMEKDIHWIEGEFSFMADI